VIGDTQVEELRRLAVQAAICQRLSTLPPEIGMATLGWIVGAWIAKCEPAGRGLATDAFNHGFRAGGAA